MGYMEVTEIENTSLTSETLSEYIIQHEKKLLESVTLKISIDELDTAGYQFLCSLSKRLGNSTHNLIIQTTPYFCELLKQFGLKATLNELKYETA